jgi:hypothetical protein
MARLRTIRGLLVLAGLYAAYTLMASETQEPLVTFQTGSGWAAQGSAPYNAATWTAASSGAYREFVVDADGSVVLYAGNVLRWQEGKWSQADNLRTEGSVYDAVRAPDGKWFIVCQQSLEQAVLYQYSGSTLTKIAVVPGRFMLGTTLHLASDGVVWIASKGPNLYGVKDGKPIIHEIFPGLSSQSYFSSFPPIVSLSIPNRGLWFWSHGDYRANRAMESMSLKGFQIYDEGQWRTAPHPGGLLGGATLIDSNNVLYATRYQGLFSLSTADRSGKDVDFTLPDKEACVFLHSTPSRRVIAITAEPIASSQLMRTEAGAFGKLVVFENGRAKVLLDGIDLSEGRFDKGRPVVDTSQGTFIATVGRGLVFISSDGSQARRLDWRYNIPTPNVDRMRVQGDLLYLLDRTKGFAIVNWKKLLNRSESLEKDRWKVYVTATEPASTPDGALWWLDANNTSGQLNRWREGNLTHVSLEGSGIARAAVAFVAADTKGSVWLLPQQTDQSVARFKNGKWLNFKGCDAAWKEMALQEKGNPLFGFGECPVCPIFDGNGKIVYRDNTMRRIRYFNGELWITIPFSPSNEFNSTDVPLSFVNGILTAKFRSGYYQFIEGRWQSKSSVGEIAAWPLSTESSIGGMGIMLTPPGSFPGDKNNLKISLRDSIDTVWMGNIEELYRGVEDFWIRLPTAGTPLYATEYLTKVLVDESGDVWFVLQNGASLQLAHYISPGKRPMLEWTKPPDSITRTTKAVFAFRVQGVQGRGMLRYRSDEGSWLQIPWTSLQQELVVENLPNGAHTIEVRAYDELLRSSQPLTCAFEVKRDYSAEVRDLISQIETSGLNKRETIARTLVSIGRIAEPALKAKKEKADGSLRWWIQAILDEIDRNEKTELKTISR